MNKVFTKVTAVICTFIFAFSFVSCAENADATTTAAAPDYTTVKNEIFEYQNGFGEYMMDESNGVYFKTSDGLTPAENNCTVSYLESEDGTYKKCSVVATRGEIIECDEYFLISDSMVFVARAPMSDVDEPYVDQYVIISGTLYMINDEQETIDPVAKPDSLDLYLSFSELKSLYGNFDE